jgi:hypothetical protein
MDLLFVLPSLYIFFVFPTMIEQSLEAFLDNVMDLLESLRTTITVAIIFVCRFQR